MAISCLAPLHQTDIFLFPMALMPILLKQLRMAVVLLLSMQSMSLLALVAWGEMLLPGSVLLESAKALILW